MGHDPNQHPNKIQYAISSETANAASFGDNTGKMKE